MCAARGLCSLSPRGDDAPQQGGSLLRAESPFLRPKKDRGELVCKSSHPLIVVTKKSGDDLSESLPVTENLGKGLQERITPES